MLDIRFKTTQVTEGKMKGLSAHDNKHVYPGAFPQILGFAMTRGPRASPGRAHLLRFLTTDFRNLQLGLPELFQTPEFFQTPITGWL